MKRYLVPVLLILLVASAGTASWFWCEAGRLRDEAACRAAEATRGEETITALQELIRELRQAVTQLRNDRSRLDERLHREVAALRLEHFPHIRGADFPALEWEYPRGLPRFTGGSTRKRLEQGHVLQGMVEHESANVYATEDDFFTVVDWYRRRMDAFVEKMGNKSDANHWLTRPHKEGEVASRSTFFPRPEPSGLYVYVNLRSDKADEPYTATLAVRGPLAGMTAFVTRPAGKGKSKTMITLVRDRVDLRYQPPAPPSLAPSLLGD